MPIIRKPGDRRGWNTLAVSPSEGDDFSPAKEQNRDAEDRGNRNGIEPLIHRSEK